MVLLEAEQSLGAKFFESWVKVRAESKELKEEYSSCPRLHAGFKITSKVHVVWALKPSRKESSSCYLARNTRALWDAILRRTDA